MAKFSKGLAAYRQAKPKAAPSNIHYFTYTGTNLMGLGVDDIFSAKDERDLREKLAKQFIVVKTVTEISQKVYQIRFESKRNKLVDTSQRVVVEKKDIRQKQLDEGTIDPEEEIENFIDRFKKFIKEKK